MKSGIRTIIYSGIALLFMGLFAFCCIHNGAILPEGLAQYIGQGPVEVTDAKMLFEILGMIYPFFAILLFAPLTCMLLRRGCNAIGLLFAVLWSVLVFVMEIFYASDINGKTIGLFNMDFTVETGNIGWLYLALIVICLFSSVISAVGFGEKFDNLLSEDYEVKDRVKGILLSILFSNIIMTVVAFITFIPPVIMAFINYGITGEDIPTILHAFIAENAIIALIGVGSILMIIASIYIWKYIILGAISVAQNVGNGSGSSSGSSSGFAERFPELQKLRDETEKLEQEAQEQKKENELKEKEYNRKREQREFEKYHERFK